MNPEEKAFLEKIASEPDEDVHRLVYADWLEENRSERLAKFIRNCIGSQHFWRVVLAVQGRIRIAPVEGNLIVGKSYEFDSVGTFILGDGLSFPEVSWRRGMVERLAIPWNSWLGGCDQFVSLHPIRMVKLTTPVFLKLLNSNTNRYYIRSPNKSLPFEYHDLTAMKLLKMEWPDIEFDLGSGFTP